MASAESGQGGGGIGFSGLLTLLFIGLKLGHVIAWSWWWVLSPLLFSLVFWFVIGSLLFVLTGSITGRK